MMSVSCYWYLQFLSHVKYILHQLKAVLLNAALVTSAARLISVY